MRLHLSILLVTLLAGCSDAPPEPRGLKPRAEGAAKDIRPAADAPVVEKAAVPQEEVVAGPDSPDGDRLRSRVALRPTLDDIAQAEFRQPTEQEAAANALGRIGRAAVPSLIQALRHRESEVRRRAALVLARIGPDAAEAVPELTAALDDPDEQVRKSATRALGQIGPAASEAVPALMRRLVDPRPQVPELRPRVEVPRR